MVSVENPDTGYVLIFGFPPFHSVRPHIWLLTTKVRYTIVEALLSYLDRILEFKTSVFNALSTRSHDCFAYPLISLVSESYAIYKYLIAMLRALHTGECTHF